MCALEAGLDFDKLAPQYARDRSIVPAVLQALRATGGIETGSKVLEVGCGTGNYIIEMFRATGCSASGIDRSRAMLEHALARHSGVTFAIGDAARLDFPDDTFDLVFSVDLVHHLGAPQAYYREARRVLRRGGKLCTMTHSERQIRTSPVLSRYFPETVAVNLARYPTITLHRKWMKNAGFRECSEAIVTEPMEITDSRAYADKAYSALHLISRDAFERGHRRLEEDLTAGPVLGVRGFVALRGTK